LRLGLGLGSPLQLRHRRAQVLHEVLEQPVTPLLELLVEGHLVGVRVRVRVRIRVGVGVRVRIRVRVGVGVRVRRSPRAWHSRPRR